MTRKKKIIIIALVVVVVAWLLWKRKGAGGLSDVDVPVGLDPNNLADCMTAAFGNDPYAAVFRQQVGNVVANANQNQQYRQAIMARAAENGFTYEQQLVLQGAYQECYRNDSGLWTPIDEAHKAYCAKVKERLAAM